MSRAAISVTPARPAFDAALGISLSGLPAGGTVTLRASQTDLTGTPWAAAQTFVAGADGTVVVDRPMGLITSMTPDATVPIAPPEVLTLVAEVDAAPVAVIHVERLRVPDGVVRSDFGDGRVAACYEPAGTEGGLPGVVLLGGSEGGLHESDAALLAAHGFVVVALAYFRAPGLPPMLVDVPLEHIAATIDRLAAHPRVDPARVVVAGGSKGGEAALLVGAHFPAVRGVVSVVGSGVVTQGIGPGASFLDIVSTPVAGWTLGGEPVPYLPHVVPDGVRDAVAQGTPVALRSVFAPALDLPVRAAAEIPVERIDGPVLLLSTQDDQGYGPAFHEVAAARLAAHGRVYEHVVYPDAGHLVAAPPYGPTTVSVLPGPGVLFDHGGTPEGTAFAREDAWRRLREFVSAL
jgi:dienelactone hydrolase